MLGQEPGQLRALIDGGGREPAVRAPSVGDGVGPALDWLDQHARWEPGMGRRRVAAQLGRVDGAAVRERYGRRARVGRGRVAGALARYYRDRVTGAGTYRAECDGREVLTSVVSRPGWLDLACTLSPDADRLELSRSVGEPVVLDDGAAMLAVRRHAEADALGTRVTNAPVYRLLDVDVRRGQVGGTVALAPFVRYALTADLLESELVDALAAGGPATPGGLPARDRHLPDLASVFDPAGRLCAGGVLALCAVARPADPYRGAPDYALLVQERSGHVLNAAGRLSVIPKAFHQPLVDSRADTRIGATLRRELEEELFGRADVDSTNGGRRAAAPMHPSRLSEPMRWLTESADRLRMECTGFGFNLVSGNYEFASLIVIEDEEFWTRFGGHIEANWEASGLRQFSSLDRQAIAELISDESWSNEGLFALLQGLRRLRDVGAECVDLPAIEWTLTGGS